MEVNKLNAYLEKINYVDEIEEVLSRIGGEYEFISCEEIDDNTNKLTYKFMPKIGDVITLSFLYNYYTEYVFDFNVVNCTMSGINDVEPINIKYAGGIILKQMEKVYVITRTSQYFDKEKQGIEIIKIYSIKELEKLGFNVKKKYPKPRFDGDKGPKYKSIEEMRVGTILNLEFGTFMQRIK